MDISEKITKYFEVLGLPTFAEIREYISLDLYEQFRSVLERNQV
jgi:hypothetical protein